MSTLRRQESPGAGCQRIACAQVESAIRCLTRQAGQAVAASDAIDQAQAALAMIEPDLPRPAVRRDRAILARLRGGLAEMTGPTRLLDQLNRHYKKPSGADLASAVKSLRKRWAAHDQSSSAMSSKAGSFNPAIYRLVADMAELRGHMEQWPVGALPKESLPRGLRRTYTKARRLANEPVTADTLDALAGVLVELTAQIGLISKACPTMLKAQRKLLARAADVLADLQQAAQLDLALREALGKTASKALPKPKPLADQAAEVLQSDLAAALAESPAAFMRRVQAYWSAWGSDAAAK